MKPSSHQTQPRKKSKGTLMDPWSAAHGSWANAWCMDRETHPVQTNSEDRSERKGKRSGDAYEEE
jgi:hypothetical protein